MRLLVLADIDDFHWQHGAGRADVLLSCGDVSDPVILEAAEAWRCPLILAVKGNHDREDGVHCGFDGLRAYIERARPRLLVHGHQHVDRETQVGVTRVIGVYGHKVIDLLTA